MLALGGRRRGGRADGLRGGGRDAAGRPAGVIGAGGVAVLAAALVLRRPRAGHPGAGAARGRVRRALPRPRGHARRARAAVRRRLPRRRRARRSRRSSCARAGRSRGSSARRAAVLVGAAAGGVLVGLVVLAAAATPLDGGLGLEAVGHRRRGRARRCARPRGGAIAMSVAVVGSLSLDFVDGGAPRVGGGPFYAARALRALGASAVIAAKCAAPDRHLLLPPLIRLGLPVRWQDSSVSAAFSFTTSASSGGCRSRRSPIRGPRRRRWRRSATRAGCRLRRSAARTSRPRRWPRSPAAAALLLDGQGLVRPARIGPLELDADYDPAVLRSVSILKLVGGRGRAARRRLRRARAGPPRRRGGRGHARLARLHRVRRRGRRARPRPSRSPRPTRPARATRSRPPTSSPAAAARRRPRRPDERPRSSPTCSQAARA